MSVSTIPLIFFTSGALVLGYVVAGLFFLSFWRRSRDRLFALFAASFWILAIQRTLLARAALQTDDALWLYVLRLLAFLLIIVAIIDKNRSPRTES